MEDRFDKIFYLVISIIYMVFSYIKKNAPKEQPTAQMTQDTLPPLPAALDWESPWKEVLQKTPAPARYTQQPIPSTNISRQPVTHQQPKIERVLNRYTSLKKAIVMSEIIRPYN